VLTKIHPGRLKMLRYIATETFEKEDADASGFLDPAELRAALKGEARFA
jgi:hypothetical protein